jgi:(4S)-4-hydroxy-5-phosphonooxypentane-2,3-dione isomerase
LISRKDLMFVLVVLLRVRPEKDKHFVAAIEANAAASRGEPGCRRFDVVRDNRDPHHYVLYEIYDDEAAFQAHRTMPHFTQWRKAAAECLQPDGGQVNIATTLLFSGDLGQVRPAEHQ